jgi:transposase
MRKSFDGLCGLVINQLGQNPMTGDVFIFMNRRRSLIKLLVWDQTGFVIYYKRLEKGTFELPSFEEGKNSVKITRIMKENNF